MIKRFVVLRRKPDMSVEEFWDYWENTHGLLIANIPGLIKYIQYHVKSERVDKADDPIDGIAELWFESEETQKEAYQSPEYQAVVEDEPNLFKMSSHYVHPVMTKKIVTVVDKKIQPLVYQNTKDGNQNASTTAPTAPIPKVLAI